MPEAIATTKRKFYKALDALTAQASRPSRSEELASSATKRPTSASAAFDEARERAKKRLRRSVSPSGSTTLTQDAGRILVPSRLPSNKAVASAKPPPHFSPWSHEAFLARLKTFSSVSMWHPKPDAICEIEWAKHGWVCVEVDIVACRGGCEKRVVVNLDRSTKDSVTAARNEADLFDLPDEVDKDTGEEEVSAEWEQSLTKHYQDIIVSGHAESCLWRKAGCKDDIYRLPLVRPIVWQPELRSRFHAVLDVATSVSEIKLQRPEDNESKVAGHQPLLAELPTEVIGPCDETAEVSGKAFEIAMHGWRGDNESGTSLLRCDACFQRIGLWMYQPGYRPGQDNDEDQEGDEATINLLEMHRHHCPWRNSESQQAPGSLSGLNGCEILQRVVATCARDHRRRTQEHRRPDQHEVEEHQPNPVSARPVYSREEIAQQDKERESRLQKLKSLFTITRKNVRPKA